jgi:hypothetical protein
VATEEQPKGKCAFCGEEVTRGGAPKHLRGCAARQAAAEAAARGGKVKTEGLLHLRLQDKYREEYWLDVEMRSSGTFAELDAYLRAIWLDCCGHPSRFSVGGWKGEDIRMDSRLGRVFEPGVTLVHTYDFGSSSYTFVRHASSRLGAPLSEHPVALLARNLPPAWECAECGKPAEFLCMHCVVDGNAWTPLCPEHVKKKPHDKRDPAPLVNSPRVGVCAYAGAAEPPY